MAPYLLGLLRVMTAFNFMQHGAQKLFGIFGWPMPAPAAFPSQMWFAGVLELFGGLLMFLGLCTRPVAFILAGEMAVAYFQGHARNGFWPIVNMGELAVLYCLIWLYFAAAGAGPLSLDALLSRRRNSSQNSPRT